MKRLMMEVLPTDWSPRNTILYFMMVIGDNECILL